MSHTRFTHRIVVIAAVGLFACLAFVPSARAEEKTAKLKGLLVTGGCCHDYKKQQIIIPKGISQRASISWDIVFEGKGDIFKNKDWAKGYDVVVHNQCHAKISDPEIVANMVRPHKEDGVAALIIHCALHTARDAKVDSWREFLGVTSRRHERGGREIDAKNVAKDHPIMTGVGDVWKVSQCELYVIEKEWPNCRPLAKAYGRDAKKDFTCVWTNEYGKARVIGISLGHTNDTVMSDEMLGIMSRGVLWAVGKLNDDGTPAEGYQGSGIGPIFEPEDPTKQPTPAD